MKNEEKKVLDRKVIYEGPIFKLESLKVQNGNDVIYRDVVYKSDSMTVLVVDDDTGKVLIEKECRVPVEFKEDSADPIKKDNTWGLPAGLINPDEDPYVTAVREVKEETGLEITQDQLRRVGVFPLSEGFTNEKSHVFICHLSRSKTSKGETHFDKDENILDYKWVSLNSAKHKVHSAAGNIAMLELELERQKSNQITPQTAPNMSWKTAWKLGWQDDSKDVDYYD